MSEIVGVAMSATAQVIPYVGFWDYVTFFAAIALAISVPVFMYRRWKGSASPAIPGVEPDDSGPSISFEV